MLNFEQSDCMKKYIDFNNEKRTNAANSFEKKSKLMINSVYEKTIENLRKRIRLVNNEKYFLKYTNRPTHITHKIFDKNYAAIHEIKPIYVGFTVLELTKSLMYDFHCNFIKKTLMPNCCLLIQTVLLMKSEDVYEEFFKDKHLFDFSNFSKDFKFFDPVNKKVIGKMKDVSEGKIDDAFVGLKSKMYSMKNIDDKKSNTAKGVNIATEFNEFKDTLFNKK